MKHLNVCPATLKTGYDTYSPTAIKELFEGKKVSPFIDISFDSDGDQQLAMENMGVMSISGAQEKFSAVVDDGKIRLAKKGEQATHILKPAPMILGLSTRKQIPANEHLTMQIASQVYGIQTAKNGLCFSPNGQPVYITKRFDVNHGIKNSIQEDFASVLEMTEQGNDSNFKYKGNYVQIADAIKQFVPAWLPQMEQFFKMVVFDYLYANGDAHMKNFSLTNKGGEYFLAPAYDLMNTGIHFPNGSDFALEDGLSPEIEKSDVYETKGHPCRLDFERFAQRIGMPAKRTTQVLDQFMAIPSEAYTLIDNSFLNDKMKRYYKRVIEERNMRFVRKSE